MLTHAQNIQKNREEYSDIWHDGYNWGYWHQPEKNIDRLQTELPNFTESDYFDWLEGYHRGWSHRNLD